MSAQFPKLEVRFRMGLVGTQFDLHEPVHLDGLVLWALASITGKNEPPKTDEEVPPIFEQDYIGMAKCFRQDHWCWWASCLFPGPEPFSLEYIRGESVEYWRKRTQDLSRMHMVDAAGVSPTMGVFRDYNMPCPLLHISEFRAWCRADKAWLEEMLSVILCIGKNTNKGWGQIAEISVEHAKHDWGVQYEGRATRYVPFPDQKLAPSDSKLVRPRPPYWNLTKRLQCARIGMQIDEPQEDFFNSVDKL